MVSKWPCRNSRDGWNMRREKARWRTKIHVQTPSYRHLSLELCVYVTRMRSVQSMQWARCAHKNVRPTGECVYTPRRTHCSRYYMCTKPWKICQKKINIHHSMTISTKKKLLNSSSGFGTFFLFSDFIIPCPSWSFLLVLVPSVGFSSIIVSGRSRFPEACVSEKPTFPISWFSMMPLHGPFPIV